MNIQDILDISIKKHASDVFIVPGSSIAAKIFGNMQPLCGNKLSPNDTYELITQIYSLREMSNAKLIESGDDDFSFSVNGVGRFRCSAYRQRNSYAMVIRLLSFDIPKPSDFGIPREVLELANLRKGMVLITGPAGSGKSTTLACMIDRINEGLKDHIITIEDPIEFIHHHKSSIVSQREIACDTRSYACALRAALRQSPDVILLGEMRDLETIQTALTAAETGQLLLSTLHTTGAAKTIDRIVDVFPANQQQQIRIQLSMVLKAVVSQQLIPTIDGGRVAAFEIMKVNSALRNMIRENKTFQMDNVILAGAREGMRTMDSDILRLYEAGTISKENAISYASNPDILAKKIT